MPAQGRAMTGVRSMNPLPPETIRRILQTISAIEHRKYVFAGEVGLVEEVCFSEGKGSARGGVVFSTEVNSVFMQTLLSQKKASFDKTSVAEEVPFVHVFLINGHF